MIALNGAIAAALCFALGAGLDAAAQSQAPAPSGSRNAPATWASPEPFDGQILRQGDDTVLGSVLKGLEVYDPDGQPIGDINDVIVRTDGGVEGVVVGIGGFLGFGEKGVAVRWDKIGLVPTQDGGARAVLNATREELDEAPVFRSKADEDLARRMDEYRRQWMEDERRAARQRIGK
jgi:sporulation protein YlmC with PRC-barrel domain